MKKSALLFGLVIAFTKINAQTINSEKAYIEVVGTCEKEIVPNQIYINIILKERFENKEKITIEKQEEKLKGSLKEIGIDLKNLSLSDANADYIKVKWKTKDVVTKKAYTLMVSSAKQLTDVYQQLDKIEINDANVSKISHSKLDSLKKETRIEAIKAAKEKAIYLLAGINEQIGKPLEVKEENNSISRYEPNTYAVQRRMSVEESFSAEDNGEIQFKKIKITSSIYTKFEIK